MMYTHELFDALQHSLASGVIETSSPAEPVERWV